MSVSGAMTGLDWIAADWGTSSLRVWAMAADGSVLDHASSGKGMGRIGKADYEPALLELAGPWLEGRTARVPVIVCGMAGARQGWTEAAYRTVPCAPVSADALTRVETDDPRLSVHIVPGLCQMEPEDVMRGEETQLAGFLASAGKRDAVICLPGTHSKWASIENGQVARFSTVMTGELFDVIASNSILRHSVGETGHAEPGPAFLEAVSRALARPETVTAGLFSIRARSLLRDMSAEDGRDTLSGLLIGAELAGTRSQWQGHPVHLIGADALVTRYVAALKQNGADPVIEDGSGLTLAGLGQVRAGMKELAV